MVVRTLSLSTLLSLLCLLPPALLIFVHFAAPLSGCSLPPLVVEISKVCTLRRRRRRRRHRLTYPVLPPSGWKRGPEEEEEKKKKKRRKRLP